MKKIKTHTYFKYYMGRVETRKIKMRKNHCYLQVFLTCAIQINTDIINTTFNPLDNNIVMLSTVNNLCIEIPIL